MSATWTDDRVETLARLWKDGLSASQIARSLGGVTRNAVIGKVHRMGLCGRARPHVPGAERPDRRRERRERIAPRKTRRPPHRPSASPQPVPETGFASILSVRPGQCRWPIGEPRDQTFCLCGRPRERGAYCGAHGAVAYRATERDHLVRLAGRAASA